MDSTTRFQPPLTPVAFLSSRDDPRFKIWLGGGLAFIYACLIAAVHTTLSQRPWQTAVLGAFFIPASLNSFARNTSDLHQTCILLFFFTLRLLNTESARTMLSQTARMMSQCLIVNTWWGLCLLICWKVPQMWLVAAWCFVFIPVSAFWY